jgi:hypothetical protein
MIETPKSKPLTPEEISKLETKQRIIVQWTEEHAPTEYLVERTDKRVYAVISYGEEGGIWSRTGAGRLEDAHRVWRVGDLDEPKGGRFWSNGE